MLSCVYVSVSLIQQEKNLLQAFKGILCGVDIDCVALWPVLLNKRPGVIVCDFPFLCCYLTTWILKMWWFQFFFQELNCRDKEIVNTLCEFRTLDKMLQTRDTQVVCFGALLISACILVCSGKNFGAYIYVQCTYMVLYYVWRLMTFKQGYAMSVYFSLGAFKLS